MSVFFSSLSLSLTQTQSFAEQMKHESPSNLLTSVQVDQPVIYLSRQRISQNQQIHIISFVISSEPT